MKKNKGIVKIVSHILLITLIFSATFGLFVSCKPKVEKNFPFEENTQNQPNNNETNVDDNITKRKEDSYNFLVIGRDEKGTNTDVIMVANFDVKNKKIAIVQIPRDSYVLYNDNGRKINSVYAAGYNNASRQLYSVKGKVKGSDAAGLEKLISGMNISIDAATLKKYANGSISHSDLCAKYGIIALEQAIKDNFGIVTDYYVSIGLEGFRNIVDAIGGVDVYVQENMYYNDPDQNLYINIKKGNQHLDGKAAEGFVRYRYGYVGADITRISAQKIFMTAFLDKLFSVSTVTKIPELVNQVFKYVATDVSLSDATYFAVNLISLDLSNITMLSMQGVAKNYNGASIYAMNRRANLEIVNSHFNVFNKDIEEETLVGIALDDTLIDADTTGSTAQQITDTPPELDFIRRNPTSSGTTNKEEKPKEEVSEPENTENSEGIENAENTENIENTESAENTESTTEPEEITGESTEGENAEGDITQNPADEEVSGGEEIIGGEETAEPEPEQESGEDEAVSETVVPDADTEMGREELPVVSI